MSKARVFKQRTQSTSDGAERSGTGGTPAPPQGPRAREAVRALTAYNPGPADPRIDLYLDENEGPPPPASLVESLRRLDPELIRRYPTSGELQTLLARRHGVEPERIFISAGADESLDRACRAFLEPGREIILPVPTFEMLVRYARLAGATAVHVPWARGPYPTEGVLGAISVRTGAIAFISPNNPTGAVGTGRDLERLAAAAPGALMIVDAAYAEFADEDLTPIALRLPNALVLRTLSKARGLAGLRVGYSLGPPEVIRALRIAGPAYPVAGTSIALATAYLLAEGNGHAEYVARVRRERRDLESVLRGIGADPIPSQANFVTAFFGDAQGVKRSLLERGIAVHGFAPGSGLEKALRITCPGDEALFDRLTAALKAGPT
jgi:histidinol-phosphate aminotransferase